ncbi:ATP-dependent DNA helicase Q4-like isoform X2 [Myxocyprinus asiaticus]|uniref:ATP-dependent DNA helicase Q4-like isoform X2 n=1 Tax=Myxocyprinus asiaticus TaxID=70543 RepID=UPI002221DDDA|nr:ATP-dependent DNA helicase Q4-like isoform X2 [Myxocyprinus asiaticus]XP_051519458.1 ATP-dependent DNA helicase Q4-like isoform X2 [Myxocyprinus asiaticus]XP_051519459.1 ATP-dependent DNA helicase Q4-like isoform X2 [Myxocyprinus asiaticus]
MSDVCHMHERAIPMQETVETLDITEESVETLLCYLDLHPQQWVEPLHPTLSVCKLQCYGGPQQLRTLTKLYGLYGGTGWSGVHVEFSDLSFYIHSYGNLTVDELFAVCALLHSRVMAQERTQLYQLKTCFTVLCIVTAVFIWMIWMTAEFRH